MRTAASLVALLALVPTAEANPMNQRLLGASEEARAAVFAALLRQSPYRCAAVERTLFQAVSPQGQAIWSIGCGPDGDFLALVAPDEGGSLRVITCAAAVNLGLRCWTPLEFARAP